MSSLIRFTVITLVLAIAALLILAVGGVFSSSQLWHSALKIVELIAILFVTSAVILIASKK